MKSNFSEGSFRIPNDLQNIISDNVSGSTELLHRLITYFNNHKEEIDLELISSLQKHFSNFQTIQDFLTKLTEAINKKSSEKFLLEFPSDKIFERIYRNLETEIQDFDSFITISNSKTILEVLKLFAKDKSKITVFVSEGRPVCEGKILAEKLIGQGINTSLITEAQIYKTIENCDCGIIGADKILSNGNVINKVGSNLLALACKEFHKPLYVIADSTKFSKDDLFDKKEMPRNEIYSGNNDEIKIINYYFELIPTEYITKIITD